MKAIKAIIDSAEAIVIGAGSGLSASAGFAYAGERFYKYFSDFSEKYGFCDMYSGGFENFYSLEENWAYWSRMIYANRYTKAPSPVYEALLNLVAGKNYFVITTNVDHCFQKAGFEKGRLFYTQGDYGLWQCSEPCHQKTYDNESAVKKMVLEQGFVFSPDGNLEFPKNGFAGIKMQVCSESIPHCPKCGKPMEMNLRKDKTFVEDDGWKSAAARYEIFLTENRAANIVFLEIGVGSNTPGIIKYPFWQMTYANPKATYICINKGEAAVPKEIEKQSVCLKDDIFEVLKTL